MRKLKENLSLTVTKSQLERIQMYEEHKEKRISNRLLTLVSFQYIGDIHLVPITLFHAVCHLFVPFEHLLKLEILVTN